MATKRQIIDRIFEIINIEENQKKLMIANIAWLIITI